MNILWLVPHYYSFIKEELEVLAGLVSSLTVVTQADPVDVRGVQTLQVPATERSLARTLRRARSLASYGRLIPWPRSRRDLRDYLAITRQCEFIAEVAKRRQIDVVHSHFAWPRGCAGLPALGGLPLVLTLRGVDLLTHAEYGYGLRLQRYFDRSLSKALRRAAVVTVASGTSMEALEALGGPSRRYRLLPNGVDLCAFHPSVPRADVRATLGVGGRLALLSIGNLIKLKQHAFLIDATAMLRARGVDAMAVIVGDGPERAALELQAAKAGLGEHVIMPGRIERQRLPEYIAACDVFVHTARVEGFGNVVLEAMAVGKPVVATPAGVARDLIEHGVNGLIVPFGDASAIAEAVETLSATPGLADRYGEHACNRVRAEDLSAERRAEGFLAVYREVTQSQPSGD